MYPLIPNLINAEGLLTAHNAQAWDQAFTGHIIELDKDMPTEAYMRGPEYREFVPPRTGEISPVPGKIAPYQGSRAGPDAQYMEQFFLSSLGQNTPDEAQFGGGGGQSGRQLVIERGLLQTAHRQIPQCGLRVTEFVAETTLRLMCGLARGQWQSTGGHGVNVAFQVNVEPTPGLDGPRGRRSALEFQERWVGEMYDIRAEFPRAGNIAEIGQLSELYDKGQASWSDLMEARGKLDPMAERVKIKLDRYWDGEEGQAELLEYALTSAGRVEQADKLKAMRTGKINAAGMPTAAVAPEAQLGAPGPAPGPGGPPGPMTSAPGNIAQAIYGSEVSADLGTSTLAAEAQAANAVGGPTAPVGGGALPGGM